MKKRIVIGSIVMFMCLLASRLPAQEDPFQKGLLLINSRQYAQAVTVFSEAIKAIPNDYEAYNYRGVARAYMGKYDQAIADYTAALEIKPGYAEAIHNRGFAWVKKGNLRQALRDFSRAIEIKPALVDAYNSKAWILATSSDTAFRNGAAAIELAQKSVKIEAGVDSIDTLAAAQAAAGRFAQAAATQKKAIQLLVRQDRTDEIRPYLAHLQDYKAGKALRIDYSVQAAPPGNTAALKKPAASKKAIKPAARTRRLHSSVGTAGPRPYTIQVSAYREAKRSLRAAAALIAKGDPAFTCPVHIPGKGDWYRVYIGSYGSMEKARQAAMVLKKRNFNYAHVTRKPYAVQIGVFGSDRQLRRLASRLQAQGYMSYSLAAAGSSGKTRLLVGAYDSRKDADKLAARLKAKGFTPRVLER